MSHRPAVSRVEVLVGIVIAVLIVGLFLSGMCRIGESSRRMKCQNNLKQLGLAVHNYELTDDLLPALTDQGNGAPTGRGLPSVFANLMVYLENDPWNYTSRCTPTEYHAHSSVDFTVEAKGHTFTEHGGIANTSRSVFLCPYDTTANQLRDVPMTLPDGSTGYYATGSYAANGLLTWGASNLTKACPRGTANTILMAERPQVCRTASGDEVFNLWGVGFYSPHMPAFACLTPTDAPGLASTGQVAPVEPLPPEGEPIPVRIGRRDAAPQSPDFESRLQRIRDGRPCDPRLPGGPHPSGMIVLMADGSTRVFKWDTSPWVYWDHCLPGKRADMP